MRKILVAVTDDAASMSAARTAVDLAATLGAELRAVNVVADGTVAAVIGAASRQPHLAERRDTAAVSVLRHVADLAARAGVAVTTAQREGDVCTGILAEADAWPADVVVVGRTTRRGAGEPFLGAEAQRVLEFSDRPVLVVPA